ncbi:helix-turn-helix domain-containing protein [Pseudomonas stutzeri]|uniref:helix-turn-helix domain-containing protein n=1 Tax=Stutzerimonas stutzeri TaxID=316 RepID=UPI00210A9848|nr:helix-turn-helix domain-containing protein [Stutzerimonas stutzeri]MCQ4308637.1 helix-turn-helix domain-containing protein [Stutzerimonas stutzeri]
MSTKTTPDIEAQAVILREAGYSCPAIAEKLDLSLSTTKRILKRRSAVAGAATESLVEQARQSMLNTAFDLDAVQQHAAALVLDDLALSRMIRGKVVEVIEGLDLSTSTPYQAMRTVVAAATALELTQKVARRALPLDRLAEATHVEELSELRIRIMTDDDVREIREQQRREAAERISGNSLLTEEEDNGVVELVQD